MGLNKILEQTLSSLLGCKISVEIKEGIVDVYVTGIGGCKFSLPDNSNKKVSLIQCDISQQLIDSIIEKKNNGEKNEIFDFIFIM